MLQMLATSFGLTGPSSGQFLSFYKYWPDDGPVRPKPVANICSDKIKI
jgi:hypothetical protein